METITTDPDALLRRLFEGALAAIDPVSGVLRHLPPRPRGRTIVVGAGKAAAAMARAVEDHWDAPLEGLVVTRADYAVATRRIEVIAVVPPLPSAATREAAERLLALAAGAGPGDLLLALISGGGSSLLTLPARDLSFAQTVAVVEELQRSAASLGEINTVRRHLSAIKGGHLGLAATPAEVFTLIVSDVPGDDPTVVGSGPTVPDPTTLADARAVLDRYKIPRDPAIDAHLADVRNETPKPGDPRFDRSSTVVVSSPRMALEAAARVAREAGVTPVVLGDAIHGHAADIAATQASLALEAAEDRNPVSPPRVLLSGGESALTRSGNRPLTAPGGRNGEFLIALALALGGRAGIYAIACDTDGLDGSGDNAGAIIRPDTLDRARSLNLDPRAMLAANASRSFFAALDDLVITGPTLTNVNDFRAILIA